MLTSYFAQVQSYPGWFAINVLVPVLLPFLAIAAVTTATGGWSAFIRMLKKSVDQGQLFWVALSMLASTGYEAFSVYERCSYLRESISWTLGACMLGAFVSSIFIALSTARTLEEERMRPLMVWISIFIATMTAYGYPALHVMFSQC